MKEFIDTHFNVLVLVGLLLCGGMAFLHIIHHSTDTTALNWIEHVSDQILAALLGMMVGRATITNGNGTSGTSPALPVKPGTNFLEVTK